MKKIILIVGIVTLMLIIVLISCAPSDPCAKANSTSAKDECYVEKSKTTKDSSWCDKITGKSFKHECYTNYAISTLTPELCVTNITNPNFCISEISIITNDEALCNGIADNFWHEFCTKTIAENYNKPELCFNLTTDEDHDDCFLNTAVNFSNEELCKKISIQYICYASGDCYWGNILTDKCFRKVSVKKNMPDLCNAVKDMVQKAYCFRDHAVKNNDVKVCQMIEVKQIRDACIEKVMANSEEKTLEITNEVK